MERSHFEPNSWSGRTVGCTPRPCIRCKRDTFMLDRICVICSDANPRRPVVTPAPTQPVTPTIAAPGRTATKLDDGIMILEPA